LDDVDIVFTERGLLLGRGRTVFGEICWESITGLSAATWDTEERRISWGWVLVLGIWALFLMRRTTYAYLTISAAGGEWAFAVPDITANELRRGIEQLQALVSNRLLAT
jgi:hypothetical protein